MKNIILTVCVSLSLSLSSFASGSLALDMQSKTKMIRVFEKTAHGINYRGYQFCETVVSENESNSVLVENGKMILLSCEQIGKKDFYSEKELKDISESELTEAHLKTGGAVVGGVVIGALTIVGTGAALILTGTAATVSVLTGNLIIGAAALTTSTSSLWLNKVNKGFNIVNPMHQYAQSDITSQNGLTSSKKIVKVSEEELLDAKDLLNEIL